MHRSARAAVFAVSALSISACSRGCKSEVVAVASETQARPGIATLEMRESNFDASAGKIVWRGVSRNESKRGIVDLALDLEARRADGSVIQKRTVDVVGMRGKQMLLVPDYAALLDLELPLGERPHRVVVSIARVEEFRSPADEPIDLESLGAEKDRFRFQSLGHFHIPGAGDDKSPFNLSLGIRSASAEPIEALDLQIVFTDVEGREADRLPANPVFIPPLRSGDAVVQELSRPVRPFASFRVEARGVTVAKPAADR